MKYSLAIAFLAVTVTSLSAVGCTNDVTGSGEGENGTAAGADEGGGNQGGQGGSGAGAQGVGGQGGGTIDANTRYVPEQDPTKAQQIAARMWKTMTSAPCWYMQGSTYNYSFSGINDYRYAGYETTAGQIGLNSAGSFGGYDAADVLIGGSQYWIGVADSKTIAIAFIHDNGAFVYNWFKAANPGDYCV